MPAAAAAQGDGPAPSFEWRAAGSIPLQYVETSTPRGDRQTLNGIPYLALTATAHLPSDVSASIFANGGHGQLGSFRDNDNTFASAGSSIARRWGAFTAGVSFDHTNYFDGAFQERTNVANEFNLFASYRWTPNPGLRIRPSIGATMRMDETFAVERYSYTARLDIEQQISGRLWWVVSPRFRALDYVGSEAGRHDMRLAAVTGLKYVINDNMSARFLVGFDSRTSTVASRAAEKFTVGASIDFELSSARPRWPLGQ